jgi:tetratricopeptide (TPR) repeat protein
MEINAPLSFSAEGLSDIFNGALNLAHDDDEFEVMPPEILNYMVFELLGHGITGRVWLAEQHAPERLVAIKVLEGTHPSGETLARFQLEMSALAALESPYIARIYDSGRCRDGRPFFAMEHVPGSKTILDVVQENACPPREIARTFLRVCEGIHTAHSKEIVHRDIKPENILAMKLADGSIRPVAIDLGLAKFFGHRSEGRTKLTREASQMGTPEYMSPEQFGNQEDVSTLSDVYSLGALLYQLLTGTTPLELKKNAKHSADEYRIIAEVDPPTPSERLKSQNKSSALGDLDWIVLKALQKNPRRRYASVDAMRRDLQRYLDGDAVEAGPASAAYHTIRFVTKHRFKFGVGASLVGALAVGLVFAVRAERRATAARKVSDEVLRHFIVNVSEDLQGRARSETLAKLAEPMKEHFASLNQDPNDSDQMLLWAQCQRLQAETLVAGCQWAAAKEVYMLTSQVAERFVQNGVNSTAWQKEWIECLNNAGRTQQELGNNTAAAELLGKAIEIARSSAQETLTEPLAKSLYQLAQLHLTTGDLDAALARAKDRVDIYNKISSQGEATTRTKREVAQSFTLVGTIYDQLKHSEKAIEAFSNAELALNGILLRDQDAHENRDLQHELAACRQHLGHSFAKSKQVEKAIHAYKQAHDALQTLVDREPSNWQYRQDWLISLTPLARLTLESGDLTGGCDLLNSQCKAFREMVALDGRNLEWEREFSTSLYNLAVAQERSGKSDAAFNTFCECLMRRQSLVSKDPSNQLWQNDLWTSYKALGTFHMVHQRLVQAAGYYQKSVEQLKPLLTATSGNTQTVMNKLNLARSLALLGKVREMQGESADSEKCYLEALDIAKQAGTLPEDVLQECTVWQEALAKLTENSGA